MSRWQNIEHFGKTPKLIPKGTFKVSGWQVLGLMKNLDLLKIILQYSTIIEFLKGVLVAVLI